LPRHNSLYHVSGFILSQFNIENLKIKVAFFIKKVYNVIIKKIKRFSSYVFFADEK